MDIVKKCEFCGKEFIIDANSKKRFCDREECQHSRHEIAWRKYEEKKKKALEKKQKTIIKKEEKKEEEKIVYTKNETSDWTELLDIAKELGKIRYKLILQITKVNEIVKECNGKEQDLLHKLEIMDKITEKEATELAIKIKKNRENRRVFKNAQFLISGLLKGMNIRNPEEYVKKGIEIISNPNYEPRVLDELFEEQKDKENDDIKE